MLERAGPVEMGVTIVTHLGRPGGAPDDLLLADALSGLGVAARFAAWDDPAVHWAETSLAVVRSTWDYHHHPLRWLEWIDHVERATAVVNSATILRWNTHKRYLGDLGAAGVSCIPTVFVSPGEAVTLRSILLEKGWTDVVVKPAIGASAAGARRFAGTKEVAEGEKHLAQLLKRGDALVQPYLKEVETDRERSLVFLDGSFHHAFTKPAFNTNAVGGTVLLPHEPSPAELALARAALGASPGRSLYARADLVPGKSGPMLMELELIEPDLGLRFHPRAANRLAEAIISRATDKRRN